MNRRSAFFALRAFLVGFATIVLSACGRKATLEDCQSVVDRNVEVELMRQRVTDPVQIEKRKSEIRRELDPLVKECVGKRVTDSMMACVKRADSSKEIDECMR